MKKQRNPLKRHHAKASATVENKIDTALKSSFIGVLFTAGISLAMLFASTAAALMTDDPTAFITPIGYICKFISAFVGGYICYKLEKQSPYLTSILTGCGFVLLSILFSLALPHTFTSGTNIWIRFSLHLLSFVAFPIGTIIGVKASRSKPKRKIKKRK